MPEESALERERREKVARWRAAGRDPYPFAFPGRESTDVVRAACERLRPGEEDTTRTIRVAGRLRTIRQHGRTAFADLDDLAGSLQLMLRVDELGDSEYRAWISDLDPGDIVGADGNPAVSRRGEPSLLVRSLTLLTKAIAPPPEKFHGIQDVEERLRRRYVDLLASPDVRARFRARTLLVRELRRYLDEAGFLEVETPTLLRVASGATAAPFITHCNYVNDDLQLRIATELALKRLLVGGLERVYEIGKTFRNEDLDSTHSPEFTEMEAYWAYADYHDMRRLLEGLFERLSVKAVELFPGLPEVERSAAMFHPPFATVDFVEELERRSGLTNLLSRTREELREAARAAGSTVPDNSSSGTFLDKLFEHYVEPTLTRVTFVVDHPLATTPLARQHRSKPGRVERFEVFTPSFELANAYTELTDPDEQAERFRQQLGERGDDRYAYDADFVEALRYGLPPTTGIGMGVDRLMMGLLGIPSIKETILFPLTRER
ncbi:MAG TPA: lysine--tRNA ligase [Thermoplasmata archaeon]|nr:lysine--tRNA ligase [Thermoplasmata archaeon]